MGLRAKGNDWEDLITACGESVFHVSFISIYVAAVHERCAKEGAARRGIYVGDNRLVGVARDTSRLRQRKAKGRLHLMHGLRRRVWHLR